MTSPLDPHSKCYSHINGSTDELLDRLAVSEVCKGWPVYRDSSEWKNYRSLFTDNATVWTTWTGPRSVDDFIALSKAGKEKGVFIMHRECGTLAELSPQHGRAIGKMKATITHRFKFPSPKPAAVANGSTRTTNGLAAAGANGSTRTTNGAAAAASIPDGPDPAASDDDDDDMVEFDVDCDCRFIFFCTKVRQEKQPQWKAKYVKLFYLKDKVVPVDGRRAPRFTPDELARYPEGYRFLGAAQARLGYDVDLQLPTASGPLWDRMYTEMEKWLDGAEIDLFWERE